MDLQATWMDSKDLLNSLFSRDLVEVGVPPRERGETLYKSSLWERADMHIGTKAL